MSQSASTSRSAVRPRSSMAQRVTFAAISVAAFLIVRGLLAPDGDVLEAPPPSVAGLWQTTDPRYADRGFEILEDEFRLQVGPGDIRAYPIREIRHTEVGAESTFTVTYITSDGDGLHEMIMGRDGTARLKNPRDVIWRRR